MKSSRYQSLSLRTVPPELMFWADGFEGDRERARTDLLCNCALGLAGEAAEIDEAPSSDEIGDGYWYSYVMFHCVETDGYEPQPTERSPQDATRAAHRAAGSACELVKKHAFHGRGFDEVADKIAHFVRVYVDALASLDQQSAAETFQQNIEKLARRYPEGFFERG